MKCKFCGGSEFVGHQRCYMDVLVDENGDFLANLSGGADANIYEAEQPYGPFVCRRCGAEYEYLRITPYRPTGQQEAGTRKTDEMRYHNECNVCKGQVLGAAPGG